MQMPQALQNQYLKIFKRVLHKVVNINSNESTLPDSSNMMMYSTQIPLKIKTIHTSVIICTSNKLFRTQIDNFHLTDANLQLVEHQLKKDLAPIFSQNGTHSPLSSQHTFNFEISRVQNWIALLKCEHIMNWDSASGRQ
ncbi:hypothetical protein CEXT_184951 [Caerostris extrusa]|uniref:Uncharacterized protein n=1 Tax=Caerostris extrusa TaxID=172846 RepID=A0AAV4T9I0_CAEEX|nr:hypothetical protein CEXT_184951 [Caerostris extrusa]